MTKTLEILFTFILGGCLFLAIYYSANILKNGVISAIISLLPISIISCYIILNRNNMISHCKNLVPVLLITLLAIFILIYLLVNTEYHIYVAISFVLIIWAVLQYFRGVYMPI
jgi:hypothetical protein